MARRGRDAVRAGENPANLDLAARKGGGGGSCAGGAKRQNSRPCNERRWRRGSARFAAQPWPDADEMPCAPAKIRRTWIWQRGRGAGAGPAQAEQSDKTPALAMSAAGDAARRV